MITEFSYFACPLRYKDTINILHNFVYMDDGTGAIYFEVFTWI